MHTRHPPITAFNMSPKEQHHQTIRCLKASIDALEAAGGLLKAHISAHIAATRPKRTHSTK